MTRDVEWDDEEHAKMLALALYEAGVCECGFHRSVANDPDTLYTVDVETCPVCADIASFNRIQAAADEKAEKQLGKEPRAEVPRPGDGRHSRIRLVNDAEAEAMTSPHTSPKTSRGR